MPEPQQEGSAHKARFDALVSGNFRDAMKLPVLLALGAIQRFAVACLHQVVETRRVIGKTLVEFLNGEGLHGRLLQGIHAGGLHASRV